MNFGHFSLGDLRKYVPSFLKGKDKEATFKAEVPVKPVKPSKVVQPRYSSPASSDGVYFLTVTSVNSEHVAVRTATELKLVGVDGAPGFRDFRLKKERLYGVCPELQPDGEIKSGIRLRYDPNKFHSLIGPTIAKATRDRLGALEGSVEKVETGKEERSDYDVAGSSGDIKK
jgi:hypothetical protein